MIVFALHVCGVCVGGGNSADGDEIGALSKPSSEESLSGKSWCAVSKVA